MIWGRRGWYGSFAGLVALLLSASAANAATPIKVTTKSDAGTGSGDCTGADQNCSLRQAITAAPSGAIISLPAGIYGLTQGQLFIANSITLAGAGARTTKIKQTGTHRVIVVSSGTVTIQGVTITGGHEEQGNGGGIADEGVLTLKHSAVTGNEDDGFTLTATPLPGEGGGISATNGVVRIIDSTVSGNHAEAGTGQSALGGGIYSEVSLTIVNSTIAGNFAQGETGYGHGGGIDMIAGSAPTLILANDTIASNTASGSPAEGGNIYLDPTNGSFPTVAKDSIVAKGVADSGSENCLGTLTSQGHNLEDRNQCGFSATGDRHPASAKLGSLKNNGGQTNTLALLAGSLAINGGDPAGCTDGSTARIVTDQRGVHRPQGARCDIGAFEFRTPVLRGQPRISGTPKVGQRLTCLLPAVQSQDGPARTVVSWLRNRTADGTGRTHVVSKADKGHLLRCRVRAANSAGSVSATSRGVSIA